METKVHKGKQLLDYLNQGNCLVNVGVFNALSAAVAARFSQTKGLFISGLGFTYSHFGWPDIGLIDATNVQEVAHIICNNHPDLFVTCDIDSGLGGIEQLRRVCVELRDLGVAAVQLEDQTQDDKRCGHLSGRVIRPLEESVERLRIALEAAYPMQVIARTDASMKENEALDRVDVFIQEGAKIILVDGITDSDIPKIVAKVNKRAHIMVNVIGGGNLSQCPANEFHQLGVSIINLSAPLLFPCMQAMHQTMEFLTTNDWAMQENQETMNLKNANQLTTENYKRFLGQDDKS